MAFVCTITVIAGTLAIISAEGVHDVYTHENNLYQRIAPIEEGPTFRYIRNQGRHPLDKGVRFGWQNPIRVAPTLRPPTQFNPTEYYRDPLIASNSNEYMQYVKPSERPQIGRQKCPNGSRLDRQTGKCHNLGSSCGENMVFYEDPRETQYGQCDCFQGASRPLLYHPESRKCYFLFQQAFCKPVEWLIVDSGPNSHPTCSFNPCRQWAGTNINSTYNWAENGQSLNNGGVVALLSEKTCAVLDWPCRQEGNERLAASLLMSLSEKEQTETGISLNFEGATLACLRKNRYKELQGNNGEWKREFTLICKPGLYNKWRLDGRC